MNERINLLEPNKKTASLISVQHFQVMRFVVISLLFIVSVSSVVLFVLVSFSPLPALQKQEQTLEQNLSQSKSDIAKVALLHERTSSISTFLSTRQMLDQTIGLIESKFSGDMKVISLQTDNSVTTVTVESSSLQNLDNFLNGLIVLVQQKKGFSQVILVDLANDSSNNDYEVTVRLNSLQ
jgi:hypothetical protein